MECRTKVKASKQSLEGFFFPPTNFVSLVMFDGIKLCKMSNFEIVFPIYAFVIYIKTSVCVLKTYSLQHRPLFLKAAKIAAFSANKIGCQIFGLV